MHFSGTTSDRGARFDGAGSCLGGMNPPALKANPDSSADSSACAAPHGWCRWWLDWARAERSRESGSGGAFFSG